MAMTTAAPRTPRRGAVPVRSGPLRPNVLHPMPPGAQIVPPVLRGQILVDPSRWLLHPRQLRMQRRRLQTPTQRSRRRRVGEHTGARGVTVSGTAWTACERRQVTKAQSLCGGGIGNTIMLAAVRSPPCQGACPCNPRSSSNHHKRRHSFSSWPVAGRVYVNTVATSIIPSVEGHNYREG